MIVGIIFNERDEVVVTFPMKHEMDYTAVKDGILSTRLDNPELSTGTARNFLLTRKLGGHTLLLVPVKLPDIVEKSKHIPWHNAEDGEIWSVVLDGQDPEDYKAVAFGWDMRFIIHTEDDSFVVGHGVSVLDRSIAFAQKK